MTTYPRDRFGYSSPFTRPPLKLPGRPALQRAQLVFAPESAATTERVTAAAFPLAVRRVVLDSGHGGSDPGAVSPEVSEKSITLDIGQRERGKVPVTVGVVTPEAGSCVIDMLRQDTGRRVVAEVHARK